MSEFASPAAQVSFLDVTALGGLELAGVGLVVTVVVLGLSYGIALAWQRYRDPKRSS